MSNGHGIVLLGSDKNIKAQARRRRIPLATGELGALPHDKTLFVEPGTTVPWDLLPAAWHFLERWDAAVPLWRYGANADQVGSQKDESCHR